MCECVCEWVGRGEHICRKAKAAYFVGRDQYCQSLILNAVYSLSQFFISFFLLFLFLSLQIKDDIERFKSQGVEMEEKRKTILRGLEVKEERREMREGGRGGEERDEGRRGER